MWWFREVFECSASMGRRFVWMGSCAWIVGAIFWLQLVALQSVSFSQGLFSQGPSTTSVAVSTSVPTPSATAPTFVSVAAPPVGYGAVTSTTSVPADVAVVSVVATPNQVGGTTATLEFGGDPEAMGELAGEATDESVGDSFSMPTLGGSGTWSDCLILYNWRIQRCVSDDECRLLDSRNFCLVQGSYAQCRERLKQEVQRAQLPPMRGHAVVLLHGLATTRYHMAALGKYLEKNGDYVVINVSYATTRADIEQHAQAVAEVIAGLPDLERIDFVAHSMGNIVLRRFFYDDLKRSGGRVDPRYGRCVMLGPPNQGARAAEMLRDNPLFEKTFGQSAEQLGAKWGEIRGTLAVPPIPFAVIAGGTGNQFGFNLLLPGDDDGVVRIDEAHLEGETAFKRVPILHSLLPQSIDVHRLVLRFLQTGAF